MGRFFTYIESTFIKTVNGVKPDENGNVNVAGGGGGSGADGITPRIGDNGNWWIGTEDTGVSAYGTRQFTGELTDGAYIHNSKGSVTANSAYSYMDYWDVKGFLYLELHTQTSATGIAVAMAFYDASKNFISSYRPDEGFVITEPVDVPIPAGAVYARVSCRTENKADFKAIAKNACNPVKGVDYFTEEDKAEMVEEIADASGGSDWNAKEGEAGHILNRTHYEETEKVSEPLNITWDGNTEGLVSVTSTASGFTTFYKVSDLVLSDSVIQSATVYDAYDYSYSVADEWIYWVDDGSVTDDYVSGNGFTVIRNPATIGVWTFPEPGVYFTPYTRAMTSSQKVEYEKTTIKTIDPKYLPMVEIVNEVLAALPDGDEVSY